MLSFRKSKLSGMRGTLSAQVGFQVGELGHIACVALGLSPSGAGV